MSEHCKEIASLCCCDGGSEFAKLREELEAAQARLAFRDKYDAPFCDSCAAWEQMAWEMRQRAEAAEARIKEAERQEPAVNITNGVITWSQIPKGFNGQLFFSPLPSADAEEYTDKDRADDQAILLAEANKRMGELQAEIAKKNRVIKCRNDDLREQQESIAELEREVTRLSGSSGYCAECERLSRKLAEVQSGKTWELAFESGIAKARAEAVPDGWQVVPKSATAEMCLTAEAEIDADSNWPTIWKAMLAVAPKPEGEEK